MSLSALHPGIWAAARVGDDPYFSSVVNLSHFDGTNGSTTFVDSSTHAHNLTAGVGTAAISTAQSQFGGSSLLCGGSGNNGATGSLSAYGILTSDFTLEWWVRPNSITPRQNLVFFNNGSADGFFSNASTGTVAVFLNSTTQFTSSATLAANTWTFCAYSRIGTSGVFYMGGNSQGSWTDNLNYTSNTLCVGLLFGGDSHTLAGYIDDFRFTVGVGRYSGSTCPVPSAPFPS